MQDPTKFEQTAMNHGGQMGGEYLQSIGVYDLSALTQEQWQTFIRCIIGGYFDKMAAQNDDIPF